MEFDGELKGVPPEKAWVVLSDPMAVRDSLKGCRYITPMGDEFNFDEYGAEEDVEMLPEADPDAVADRAFIAGQKYAALMQVGVGSVKPRFETTVTIEERDDETFEMTASGGGVAYRCSFRVTEAVYLIERMMKVLADELDMDPAEVRRKNFIPSDAFPYESATGWNYDSGDYETALDKALEMADYEHYREEQRRCIEKDADKLIGTGVSSFTEVVGAGPGKQCDIAGIEMFDSADLRVNPTGNAVLRVGVQTQGQGHETTFAQIVAEGLGMDVDDIVVEHGDTDTEPYGLGTYGSRSTLVAGAAAAVAARKVRDKAKSIAANELEAAEEDIEWDRESDEFHVAGAPDRSITITEIAAGAYMNHPGGEEPGLEATNYHDPPEMTYPFGSYIVVVEVDRETGEVNFEKFVAVDDCGNRINPMTIEGQIHGGPAQEIGTAMMEHVTYDDNRNVAGGDFMNYLLPTAEEIPDFETGHTVTPSPHHPIGAKGVGESPTVASPPAIVNAVVDAGASYVGLAASDTRSDEVTERAASLLDSDPETVRAAVTNPAGVDVAAHTPVEIAVSVLAEVVDERTAAGADDSVAAAASASETDDEDGHGGHNHDTGASDAADDLVTDPVCGMTVDPETAAAAVEHAGDAYHFCCEGCADSSESDPASYLTEREAASP